MADNKFMTGISITQEEKAIVDKQKVKLGISFSATLGFIIREWAQLKANMVTIQKVGVIKDGKIESEYLKYREGVLDPRD